MLFCDVVNLIGITYTENSMGDTVVVSTEREVFANKKSVRSSEFYQAMSNGLKPELMFEVRTIEYAGEKKLSYEGKEYTIIRSYDKNGEITELVVEGLVHNATS